MSKSEEALPEQRLIVIYKDGTRSLYANLGEAIQNMDGPNVADVQRFDPQSDPESLALGIDL